jgi:DNA-binding HxlR family transcriptional regulator
MKPTTEKHAMTPTAEFCPINTASDMLGRKWALLVVHYLSTAAPGRLRFCELQEQLGGLNPATLSLRLKELEAAGLVERHAEGGQRLPVAYALTPMGRELGAVVARLNDWGNKWLTPDTVGTAG